MKRIHDTNRKNYEQFYSEGGGQVFLQSSSTNKCLFPDQWIQLHTPLNDLWAVPQRPSEEKTTVIILFNKKFIKKLIIYIHKINFQIPRNIYLAIVSFFSSFLQSSSQTVFKDLKP